MTNPINVKSSSLLFAFRLFGDGASLGLVHGFYVILTFIVFLFSFLIIAVLVSFLVIQIVGRLVKVKVS